MDSDPILPIAPAFILRTVLTAAMRRKRSFRRDAVQLLANASVPVKISGSENIPVGGPCLVTANHFTRPGLGAWWLALAISAALPSEVKWIVTGALTYPGQKREVIFLPLSRFFLTRLARVYDLFLMPPMPPRTQDAADRAAAVRAVLHFAQSHPDTIIGLAPEGRDIPGGGLGWPPGGAGRFILRLNQSGFLLLPVGVFWYGSRLCLNFGAAYRLEPPSMLSTPELDRWMRRRVMNEIACLIPAELRGEFQDGGNGPNRIS